MIYHNCPRSAMMYHAPIQLGIFSSVNLVYKEIGKMTANMYMMRYYPANKKYFNDIQSFNYLEQ